MEMREFFGTVFEGTPPEAWVLVWTLPGETSHWCQGAGAATRAATGARSRGDVYFGVGLSPRDFGPHHRCPAAEVMGIPGLWADFDLAGPAHKKANLPATIEEVEGLLAELEVPPTLQVHTGHGLQCYWLFKEPWLFAGEEEREQAAALSRGWNAHLRARAQARGWDVDATHDLARILRVPGTYNHKVPGQIVPVRVVSADGPRCNPSDFEEWEALPSLHLDTSTCLRLSREANPPFDKFIRLTTAEPRFLASWRHERKDLPDQSPSAYDMSLASLAAGAGWSDQEITDLLIAHRREHGQDLKLREDYYQRTVQKARQSVSREIALNSISSAYGEGAGLDREELQGHLSALLEIEVTGLIRYTGENPGFVLKTTRGEVRLGDINGVIHQGRLRSAIARAFLHYIPDFKADRWKRIAQGLLDFSEDCETGPEATDSGVMTYWLETYLRDNEPCPPTADNIRNGLPIRKDDGSLWIYAGHFRDFLNRRHAERIGLQALCQDLRRFGAERGAVDIHEGGHTTRSFWMLPPSLAYGVND